MKTLYLVRHAKSSWSNASLADYDRPLNERGKRDVITMGKRLKERGVMPSLILSSAAKRTTKTAKALAKEMGYDKEITFKKNLYHASILDNLKELSKIDEAYKSIMLVGHNPTASEFCDYLTGNLFHFPTCSIAEISLEIDSWDEITKGIGTLVFYDYPKNQ